LIVQRDIDTAVTRLMRARFRLGMFDPSERVPYARIPYAANQSPEHDALARRMAQASIVLLKNDGILPLSRAAIKTIAVVGPNADDVMTLLGNYYGTPAHPVTLLAGIRNAVGQSTKVLYARGADLVEGRQDPRAAPAIEPAYLRPTRSSTEPGLEAKYYRGRDLAGEPVLVRVDRNIDFRWDRGAPTTDLIARGELPAERALANDEFSVRWTGELLPPVSGTYELTVTADDGVRLEIDGRRVIDDWTEQSRAKARGATIDLKANRAYDVRLEYFEGGRDAEVRMAWKLPGAKQPLEEAIEAARAADVVVVAAGLTGDVEGEEMPVSFPGFAGGDRTDIGLPSTQQQLLRALQATRKPIVLVLMAGSALGLEWAHHNLPAVLMAWYPGQQGGNAIADVLFGDVSPSGRLPVTFYRSVDQLPPFADYGMKGRTYRYFEGQPVYPFGHGLSYTRFEYSNLRLTRAVAGASDPIQVSVEVANAGGRAGHEIVQLYVRPTKTPVPMPIRQLRGFTRIALDPGERRTVTFRLLPSDAMAYYDEARRTLALSTGEYVIEVGASSADIRLTGSLAVR
jgi:beta-glucosidase